jgi:pilus assembly protein Flp/PilA
MPRRGLKPKQFQGDETMLTYASTLVSLRTQRGLTTVEYAVAGGLIAAAVVAAFLLLGGNVGSVVSGIAGKV